MKNKIAFVAVGQAGGNIGRLLEEKGFSVLYVNTSKEDLNTLEQVKFKHHIAGGEGCNKDRHKAKKLIVDDFDNIASEIETKLKADMIFVIFASGGGTGSGAGPMLIDLLLDEGKAVGAITVLPSLEESVKSHINAYECFTELTAITGTCACFILDNESGEKISLNCRFVDCFTAFLEIPDKHTSIKGNIDKAEIMETLKAHGMAVIAKEKAENSAEVIAAVENSFFAPLEADRAIKYITISIAGNVKIADLEKAIGTPIDNFQTFNDDETICCASGLTYPQTRLEAIYEKVSAHKDLIKKNLAATREIGMKKDVNFLEEMKIPGRELEVQKPKSRRDIMNKYL